MRKLLGHLAALVAAAVLILSSSQAYAANVHCGDVITQDTTLDSDVLGCTGVAISIQGDRVRLDLNDHTVEGMIEAPLQPSAPWHEIEVLNGVVKNGGVRFEYGYHAVARDLRLADASISGSDVGQDTSDFAADHNTVSHGDIKAGNGSTVSFHHNVVKKGEIALGHSSGRSSSIADNLVEGATGEGIFFSHSRGIVARNVVRNSGGDGIEVDFGSADLLGNRIYGNAASGIALGTYGSATITGNIVAANGTNGIAQQSLTGATITRNVIRRNRLDGVLAVADPGEFDRPPHPTILDNRVDRNGGDGIHTGSPEATLTGNHTWFNGNLGIEAVPGTLGAGNWAKHNGNPLQCVPGTLCSTTGKPKR